MVPFGRRLWQLLRSRVGRIDASHNKDDLRFSYLAELAPLAIELHPLVALQLEGRAALLPSVCQLALILFGTEVGSNPHDLVDLDVAQALVERLGHSTHLERLLLLMLHTVEVVDVDCVKKFDAVLLEDDLNFLQFDHFAVFNTQHLVVLQFDQHVHIVLDQAALLLIEDQLLVDTLDHEKLPRL